MVVVVMLVLLAGVAWLTFMLVCAIVAGGEARARAQPLPIPEREYIERGLEELERYLREASGRHSGS